MTPAPINCNQPQDTHISRCWSMTWMIRSYYEHKHLVVRQKKTIVFEQPTNPCTVGEECAQGLHDPHMELVWSDWCPWCHRPECMYA